MASSFPNGRLDLLQRARSLRETIERNGEEVEIHQQALEERLGEIGELLYVVSVTTAEVGAVAAGVLPLALRFLRGASGV